MKSVTEWQKTLPSPLWLLGTLVTTVSVCFLLLITIHLQAQTSLSCYNSPLSRPMSSQTSTYSLAWRPTTQTKQFLFATREVNYSLHPPVSLYLSGTQERIQMTPDFSCVKQEEASPLAIQTTCSYSARVHYNRKEISLPPILFLSSFFFSFNGRRASMRVETLCFWIMQINQFLRPTWMQRCQDCIGWSYEYIPPSSVLPHTHPLCETGDLPVCHLGNTNKWSGRQVILSTPRHSGWMCYE